MHPRWPHKRQQYVHFFPNQLKEDQELDLELPERELDLLEEDDDDFLLFFFGFSSS
jgi:hypothetical protein